MNSIKRNFLTLRPLSKTYKVVVYNRIPKTGSTSVVRIFEALSERNDFHIYRFAIFNPNQLLNPLLHEALVDEVRVISQRSKLLVHGHFYYINLRKYGATIDHVYINCLRNPLERLVSKYYFLRFGDNLRPKVQRHRMTNGSLQMQTFEECVKNGGEDCNPERLWVQIPFFCGDAAYCNIPGSPEALQTAKRRLVEDYLLLILYLTTSSELNRLKMLKLEANQYGIYERPSLRRQLNKNLPTRFKITLFGRWKRNFTSSQNLNSVVATSATGICLLIGLIGENLRSFVPSSCQ
ncbi:Heparan sulfate 2-O-sulfotransferase 1 [Taenia crassiceps]|uniref:Heparan sulfate 2-O-sulfotransferase 1 n=1 Tax=Taenia crassiceps TaxID=6207 RepID=A0ABR4QDT0_9CEST